MKVLIVGSGGREHALAWKVAQSPLVEKVLVAPGNAGTALAEQIDNIDIGSDDIPALLAYARDNAIELTIVGPEAPLVAGIVDQFQELGLACFGPAQAAAQLEGSKTFAKEFMARHGIPTARYHAFTDVDQALDYLRNFPLPIVIKADGLAAGKGVIIADTLALAEQAVRDMLAGNAFGEAGSRVVIEQFLVGEEASFICMVDGEHILPMASSQDHKAAHDGDHGPNTGGMGAYSPSPLIDDAMSNRVMRDVIEPVVRGMAKEGNPYTGFLYAGLMIGDDGVPNVVEFNCRFGDPEAQPVLSRLRSDLAGHCLAATQSKLDQQTAEWDPRPCLGVVMASAGYPDGYEKGHMITGLGSDHHVESTAVFHAGTALDGGSVITAGGRVLCVTASADSVADAQKLAYRRVGKIGWKGAWYRTDIGHQAIAREASA